LAEEELALAQDIGAYSLDPVGFMRYNFPWESEKLPASGPRTWQNDINTLIRDHFASPETRHQPLQIAVASGHGIGKAQSPQDYLPTPDGLRQISTMRVGDYLFGEDGSPALIRAMRFYESCPFYRVRFSDGTAVNVSSGHLWKTRDRQARRNGTGWKVVSTLDIVNAGVLRANGVSLSRQWEIPASGAVQYAKAMLPVDPYTYGVWLGDGTKDGGGVTNIDPEVWDNVAYPHRGQGVCRTLYGLKKHLRKAGLFGCTTYNAKVDRRYIESSERLEVLQGLLDTDGWVEQCGGAAFASASRQLTKDVIELARSLGLRARAESFKANQFAGSWQTHITWDGVTQLFKIARKQSRLIAAESRYTAKWIDSIEEIESGPGICFEVDGGLYQTSDFIVTHNSAEIGMVIDWAMSTCEDCKVVVTAGTGVQLSTKTAPEVQKWFRHGINAHWWDINATSIRVKDPEHQAMWRADFITWSVQKTEGFAGLHNQGKRIVIIFDEASSIDDIIWEVAEGVLSDEDTEIIWIAFGNPTRNTGEFYKAITGANRWVKRQIDSRTVEGTNKSLLDAQIRGWGEDSDRARVRIRGEFPRGGSTQFISGDLVSAARKRIVDGYQSSPVILAVDVARFGDNRSVIFKRQGRKAEICGGKPKGVFYGMDTQKLGGMVQEAIDRERPDAVVIDGDGIGGAVVDYLVARRYDKIIWPDGRKMILFEFHGGAAAQDPQKYFNRRTEIWGEGKDWLEGGQIPDDPEIDTDLTAPDYGYHPTRNCIVLESKDEMRSRGVDSPDFGDAWAMTFAVKIAPPKPKPVAPPARRSGWA